MSSNANGGITAPGKFRALSSIDKKQISLFRSIIDEIGKEIALRTNSLDVLFSNLRSIAKEIPPSDAEGLSSISADTILNLQNTINQQEKAFRDDCLGIYHYELDEDLLIPIAHEALALWNRIEGFDTAAFVPETDDAREKKKARFELAKAKKEQAAEKQREEKQEKANQRELERQRREELRKTLLTPFHEDDTTEDRLVLNPRPLGYIDYSSVPLGDPREFTRALEIWTFLVSLPQVLTLSQYSLSMFLGGIQDDAETFVVQETCRMLVQVGAKGSPLVRMAVKTVGRNWFDQLRDYLLVASGAKQQKKEEIARKKLLAEKKQQAEDEAANDNGADGIEDDETKSEGSQYGGEPEESETDEDLDFATDFAGLMKAMEETKGRFGWGNFEIHDRLVILKFLVESVLQARKVVSEAENVAGLDAVEDLQLERSAKEIREECERELRAASKKKLEGEADAADAREAILTKMKGQSDTAFCKRMEAMEKKDMGARILPIGEDRYGRLYWRFPLESNVYVQTVSTTKEFPLVTKQKPIFMDDDESPHETPAADSAQQTQTVWGRIAPADLEPFISSLETRGTKECSLKAQLERYVTHLTSLAVPNEKVRITRSRAANKGYNNRLNIPAMLPY